MEANASSRNRLILLTVIGHIDYYFLCRFLCRFAQSSLIAIPTSACQLNVSVRVNAVFNPLKNT